MTTNVRQLFRSRTGAIALGLALSPVVVALAVSAGGDAVYELLLYRRPQVLDEGHWWRPFSAQFVHLGAAHLVGNLLTWLGLCVLLQPRLPARALLAVGVAAIAATAAGLVLTPSVAWYGGLSGALHGVATGCAVLLLLLRRDVGIAVMVLVLIAVKLAWEQFVGPLPGERLPADARVVTEAHLWGGVGGAFAGLVVGLLGRGRGRV